MHFVRQISQGATAMSRSVPLLADADRHLWKKLDLTLRLAIRRLLLRGHVDGPDRTPLPTDWTTEKEELFLRISTHARDCRKRATRTRLREMVQLIQGIKGTDPRNAEHIKWVLELPGRHLPTASTVGSRSIHTAAVFACSPQRTALRLQASAEVQDSVEMLGQRPEVLLRQ
jgi:hypothetical protein